MHSTFLSDVRAGGGFFLTVTRCPLNIQVCNVCTVCGLKCLMGKRVPWKSWKLSGSQNEKLKIRVCHLAQFIPPFVYSSVVNAVFCMLVCSHTSALGILKSE